MTVEFYCAVCGKKSFGQRSSAKYCSESCKQTAKRYRSQDLPESSLLNTMKDIELSLWQFRANNFNDKHSPDMLLELSERINNIREELTRMDMYLGTIEAYQANTWYQCKECGQRTFGKVESCDFCGGDDFRIIKV